MALQPIWVWDPWFRCFLCESLSHKSDWRVREKKKQNLFYLRPSYFVVIHGSKHKPNYLCAGLLLFDGVITQECWLVIILLESLSLFSSIPYRYIQSIIYHNKMFLCVCFRNIHSFTVYLFMHISINSLFQYFFLKFEFTTHVLNSYLLFPNGCPN